MEVSVLVPVYNRENTIKATLDSLVNQTMKVKIIIVDDGSFDLSKTIIEDYQKTYDNIYYHYQINSGISDARNKLVELCDTKYFAFLDSDDTIKLDAYEKMYNEIIKNDSDICMSNFYWVDNKIKLCRDINYKDKKDIYTHMFHTLWNKLYKTSWFKSTNILFPSGLRFEDTCLLSKLVCHMNKVCYVDEAFVNYNQVSGSLTHSYDNYVVDMISCFKSIIDYYKQVDLYEIYIQEIEYVVIRFIFGSSYKRICNIKDKILRKKSLDLSYNFLLDNFKNWKENKYIHDKGLKNMYLRNMNKFLYYFNSHLFHFLFKLKH